MAKCAIFWDRDDTLIADPGYLSDPDQVKLLPGAAEALKRASAAGFENIITTNQSGIARGLFSEDMLEQIHDRLCATLAQEDARIDAIYFCPFFEGEEAVVEKYRQASELRKPAPGMLLTASLERKIELVGSWAVGNSVRDCQAGRAAGCRTVLLVADPKDHATARKHRDVDFVASSPDEAMDVVLKHTRQAKSPGSTVAHDVPSDGTAVLQEILRFLRVANRRREQGDFSLARFAGAIVQMIAIGALIWALFATLGENKAGKAGVELVRLAYAAVLQLIALTFFLIASRK